VPGWPVRTASPGSGDWRAEYKLSPSLDRAATTPVEVTALLFPDGDEGASAAALAALGALGVSVYHGSVNHLVEFRLDPARLADAAALADVEWLEPTDARLDFQRPGAVGAAGRRAQLSGGYGTRASAVAARS
jgi:hypothetical protein